LVDGKVPSAIRRRTVRSASPVNSAISMARKYFRRLVISGALEGRGVERGRFQDLLQATHEQLGLRADARGKSARRLPARHFAGSLVEYDPLPLEPGDPVERRRNGEMNLTFVADCGWCGPAPGRGRGIAAFCRRTRRAHLLPLRT
jgi:hypothetical protein